MTMGFSYATSNETTEVYISEGSILSINNYEDDDKINRCITQGCNYIINATLFVNKKETHEEKLEVMVTLSGSSGLM